MTNEITHIEAIEYATQVSMMLLQIEKHTDAQRVAAMSEDTVDYNLASEALLRRNISMKKVSQMTDKLLKRAEQTAG